MSNWCGDNLCLSFVDMHVHEREMEYVEEKRSLSCPMGGCDDFSAL